MKHILKFVVGFSLVMAVLLFVVILVKYGWFVYFSVVGFGAVYFLLHAWRLDLGSHRACL